MRIWKPLCCLALGTLALAAAFTLVMTFRSHDLATPARAQDNPSIQLDMNPDNGSGPCNPVDDTVDVGKGSEYKVAICLTGSDTSPATFETYILNDKSLSECVPLDCPDKNCLDGNPDANAGSTTWGTPLGTGWDCNYMDTTPASCSDQNGDIAIKCLTVQDETLPVGRDVSAPLAVMTLRATSEGTGKFSFHNAASYDFDSGTIIDCGLDYGPCTGGSVNVGPPRPETPTPQSTATPEAVPTVNTTQATATAVAAAPVATAAAATAVAQGTPIEAVNQAATATTAAAATKAVGSTKTAVAAKGTPKPSTTEKTGGSSGPNAGLIAGLAVAGVVVVGGGGWFAFRRLRRS